MFKLWTNHILDKEHWLFKEASQNTLWSIEACSIRVNNTFADLAATLSHIYIMIVSIKIIHNYCLLNNV